MPFSKTVEFTTANTTYKLDQALGKSADNHLQRQKSHDSYFRATPIHSPSLLGLMSPDFELAPMTTWKSSASPSIGDGCAPIDTDTSGYQMEMGGSVKRTCCSGTEYTVRPHLDGSLLN
jgi:hypothetical protein